MLWASSSKPPNFIHTANMYILVYLLYYIMRLNEHPMIHTARIYFIHHNVI